MGCPQEICTLSTHRSSATFSLQEGVAMSCQESRMCVSRRSAESTRDTGTLLKGAGCHKHRNAWPEGSLPRHKSLKHCALVTAHLRVLGWNVRFLHSVVMFAVGGRSNLKDNLPHTFSQRDTGQSLCGPNRDPVASAT